MLGPDGSDLVSTYRYLRSPRGRALLWGLAAGLASAVLTLIFLPRLWPDAGSFYDVLLYGDSTVFQVLWLAPALGALAYGVLIMVIGVVRRSTGRSFFLPDPTRHAQAIEDGQ